jgi:hypothetical protein
VRQLNQKQSLARGQPQDHLDHRNFNYGVTENKVPQAGYADWTRIKNSSPQEKSSARNRAERLMRREQGEEQDCSKSPVADGS